MADRAARPGGTGCEQGFVKIYCLMGSDMRKNTGLRVGSFAWLEPCNNLGPKPAVSSLEEQPHVDSVCRVPAACRGSRERARCVGARLEDHQLCTSSPSELPISIIFPSRSFSLFGHLGMSFLPSLLLFETPPLGAQPASSMPDLRAP